MSAQEERAQLTRSEEARASNDHIAERAVELRFVSRVPMLCECSQPGCHALFLIDLERYHALGERGFICAPGHTVEGAVATERAEDFWLHERRS
jgi:hypothetical protein